MRCIANGAACAANFAHPALCSSQSMTIFMTVFRQRELQQLHFVLGALQPRLFDGSIGSLALRAWAVAFGPGWSQDGRHPLQCRF